MKNSAFVIGATVLVSLLTISESGVTKQSAEIQQKSLIDPIVKAILEKMRPKLADLKIDDVNQVIRNPNINATFIINKILIKNLDKFEIQNLKTNIVPLKLLNLTLTWKEIAASAFYDVDVVFNIPGFAESFHIYGKGDAKATLKNLFFTIGANLEMKNKTLQVKPKGLFGFDLTIKSTDVTLTSLMGSTDLGDAVGVFLSKIIPDLVLTLKKPVFSSFQDEIIKVVNEILSKQGTYSGVSFEEEKSDEYMDSFLFDFFDESRED